MSPTVSLSLLSHSPPWVAPTRNDVAGVAPLLRHCIREQKSPVCEVSLLAVGCLESSMYFHQTRTCMGTLACMDTIVLCKPYYDIGANSTRSGAGRGSVASKFKLHQPRILAITMLLGNFSTSALQHFMSPDDGWREKHRGSNDNMDTRRKRTN